MEDCLFALVHLQENNMVHADIKPELIQVPVKRGQNFQLLDRLGDPSPPNQVQLNNIKAKKPLYMSPALFSALTKKEPKVRHNPFKSDIFSLGMILLEAGLLESVQQVYNQSNNEIDHEILVDLVEKFFLKYNRNFILQEIILVMLEFSEKLRQEPIKLLKTLQSLRMTELEDSQMFNEILLQKISTSNAMDNILITSNGFQLKDTKLANLSILHGLRPSLEKNSRENNLKRSLVEMLRNRTSHNVSKQIQILEELPEQREEKNYKIGSELYNGSLVNQSNVGYTCLY
jgi:serine/threonine protein kinase